MDSLEALDFLVHLEVLVSLEQLDSLAHLDCLVQLVSKSAFYMSYHVLLVVQLSYFSKDGLFV